MTRKILALSLLSAAFASPVLAQDDEPQVQYNPETHIEFGELEVGGDLVGPQIEILAEVQHKGFNPLIELRSDFDAEMDQSVNQVK